MVAMMKMVVVVDDAEPPCLPTDMRSQTPPPPPPFPQAARAGGVGGFGAHQ